MADPSVYILLLNWNGWGDTLECLESLFRLDYPNFRVIVCDNGSEDGSLENIKAWAENRLDVAGPRDEPLRGLSFPPIAKPVAYVEHDRAAAEAGGGASDGDAKLILIRTGANLGYAGGNNVGLRYAMARGDFDYVWILNNDTVVGRSALTALTDTMAASGKPAICGSALHEFGRPDSVQSYGGGTLNRWLSLARPFTDRAVADEFLSFRDGGSRGWVYISGASMLIPARFLDDVGLIPEAYFLYYEDAEWSVRAAQNGYRLTYAPHSVVYHRESASTGGRHVQVHPLVDYYSTRNRIVFAARNHPVAVPFVLCSVLGNTAKRMARGEMKRVARAGWLTLRRTLGGG